MNCLDREESSARDRPGLPQPPAEPGLLINNEIKRGAAWGLRRPSQTVLVLFTLFLFLLFPSHPQAAQWGKVCPSPTDKLAYSWAVTPLYQFGSKVDSGGSLSVLTIITGVGLSKQLNEKLSAGLELSYIYDGYSFSGMTGFRVPYPWSSIHTFGIQVPLSYSIDQNCIWNVEVVPAIQFCGESTANFGDALIYGGAVGVSYAFTPGIHLGIGIATYYDLAQISIFPYPIVKISLSENLELTNPFGASPAGPGGGVFNYKINERWGIGLGGAYRDYRFRLQHNGPIPGGIGQYRSCPVFASVAFTPSPALNFNFYAGATLFNKIYVNDHGGDELLRTKQNAAPLIGFTASGTF